MRLIDADALKTDYFVPSTSTGTVNTQYVSLFQILNAPTVDAVEVIRCKDCKHKYYDGNQIICQKLYWCDGNNFEPSAENFCSHGERKDGDGDDMGK